MQRLVKDEAITESCKQELTLLVLMATQHNQPEVSKKAKQLLLGVA